MTVFIIGVFVGAVCHRLLNILWTALLHLTGEIKNFPVGEDHGR